MRQPSHPSKAVSGRAPLAQKRVATSGTVPPVTRVPVRAMPRLGRQGGCTARAYIHVDKRRHYLGPYDDPAVHELYARLTRVWERTGHVDLTLIQQARTPSTGHRTTIAELGEQSCEPIPTRTRSRPKRSLSRSVCVRSTVTAGAGIRTS